MYMYVYIFFYSKSVVRFRVLRRRHRVCITLLYVYYVHLAPLIFLVLRPRPRHSLHKNTSPPKYTRSGRSDASAARLKTVYNNSYVICILNIRVRYRNAVRTYIYGERVHYYAYVYYFSAIRAICHVSIL